MKGKFLMVILLIVTLFCNPANLWSKSGIVKDFKPVCDTLTLLMQERTGVYNEIKIKSIMKRGGQLDFYFTESLGDLPWYSKDPKSFKTLLKSLLPEKYKKYQIGKIFSRKVDLNHLVTPELSFDGKPSLSKQRRNNPGNERYLVKPLNSLEFEHGLKGRTIALWQSHGRYYNSAKDRWEWQRPCLFYTVEDMFTQSFVVPFLVPMLENAGAYTILPRERDFRKEEIIVDNDPSWHESDRNGREFGYGTDGPARDSGIYRESGQWQEAGVGFADPKAVYSGTESPFVMGSSRKATCKKSSTNAPRAQWTPEIKVAGDYAIYVTYPSFPESSSCALYIVHHAGGKSKFVVNQKIGGGMWIYLGTFPFEQGSDGFVELVAHTPEGYKHDSGSYVCADGVKFGGGMGNIERNGAVSGMPRNAEAARYYLQWSGADSTIFHVSEEDNDYKDDFMSRGDWSSWLTGGSSMNPDGAGKGIPIDLSFGFHSDAGVTPNDSIVGTLAIYTYKSEGSTVLPSKESRMTSREYADIVQSQIVNDIRELMNPDWSRRQIWDRGYRESRTPSSPAMLLELLSHQNFEDMKYGMDPEFRFVVSRAIYKGMLKYLSNRYGTDYVVQPLPVGSMSVNFVGLDEVEISWKERNDAIEPTAGAEGFLLYTRIDEHAFGKGEKVNAVKDENGRWSTRVKIKKGHIYSWKVAAYNAGGMSFPSEILCAGRPNESCDSCKVLIVNNFNRISTPAFIDTPDYAGFDDRTDRGVGYIRETAYIGDISQFRRKMEWNSNDNPGFGASYTEYAGNAAAGNTFDFPFIHGKAIFRTGFPFVSCSAEAFSEDSTNRDGAWCVDLICGKQITTWKGRGKQKYQVFPKEMRDAIRDFTTKGGNLLVSGSNIGTDIYDRIYPIAKDSLDIVHSKSFAKEILGFTWITNHAGRTGMVKFATSDYGLPKNKRMMFYTSVNPIRYGVESPDGLAPVGKNGKVIMRYGDTGISAGVSFEGNGYKSVCLGFPIETLCDENDIYETISLILSYLKL